MIRNIQLKHAGKYVCVVDTDVESLSAAAILIVKGKRSTARKLQIQGLDLDTNAFLALPRKCIYLLN